MPEFGIGADGECFQRAVVGIVPDDVVGLAHVCLLGDLAQAGGWGGHDEGNPGKSGDPPSERLRSGQTAVGKQ